MIDFRDRVSRILNLSKKNFGEPCVHYPNAGGSFNFTGIFDNETQSVDPDTEKLISGTQPSLGVNLFDFVTGPKEDDQIQIRNLRYKVIDVKPDGQGGATLLLHRLNHEQKVFKKRIS
jgi:hypothetical protein